MAPVYGAVWRATRHLLLLACLCAAMSACTLIKLKSETKAFYSSTVLAGSISATTPLSGQIVVAAYTSHGGRLEIAHYTVLHEAGGYELIVPKGQYALFAFSDSNGNLVLDPGEPVGKYDLGPVIAPGTGVVADLDLVISDQAQTAIPIGTAVGKAMPGKPHSTQVGAIADLDGRLFSAEFGKYGYWAPMEFFKEAGGNIYFLEAYDPAKIPVLFVHGAAGSPQDWKYFIEHMDRTRYQPWIFYYPSGASVESMSYLLYWKLLNLQRRYHFDTLYFTAHSMGGLVVRSFLTNHGAEFPAAKLFISLSTPWGGDTTAEMGIQYSPAIVPSWSNMQPSGRFMQSLFQRPLPPGVDYYLLFGHSGRYSLLREASNDGIITLASQLRPQAQAEARMVYGYNEGHVSILSAPEVFSQYAAILDTAAKKAHAGATANSGSLRIAFRYALREDIARSDPLLILTPTDSQREPIVLPIRALDNGALLGPFPAGNYEISLMAYAFATAPRKIPVTIAAGSTPALEFLLAPSGVLAGYVGADVKAGDNPAGSYREQHRDIAIASITLTGGGQTRVLVPHPEPKNHGLEAYLQGKDYATRSAFSFVGLDEGDYELTISAAGYQPYKQSYHVIPGQHGYWKPIDMLPLRD